MIDYKEIGDRISHHRKINNLTQSKLAELAEISEGYMSRIERGHGVSLEVLDKIACKLHTSLFTLLGKDKNLLNYRLDEFTDIIQSMTPEERDFYLYMLNQANKYKNNLKK